MSGRIGDWLGAVLGLALLTIGVLTGRLSVEAMLVAAWLENLSIGTATVISVLRVPGGRLVVPPNVRVEGIPVTRDAAGNRTVASGCAAGFFVAHFGLFTLVHGIFLAVIVGASVWRDGASGAGFGGVTVAVLLLAAVARAFRRMSPRRAIGQAYAGLLPVHIAIILLFTTAFEPDAAGRAPALAIVGLLLVGDLLRARVGRGADDDPPPRVVAPTTPPPPTGAPQRAPSRPERPGPPPPTGPPLR